MIMLFFCLLTVARAAVTCPPNAGNSTHYHVGILHSQTGVMAASEISVITSELLAIQEINDAGGLLGKTIVPVIVDGQSVPDDFEAAANELTGASCGVETIFGCWTSSSRKAVLNVVEQKNALLYYPLQYEGQ